MSLSKNEEKRGLPDRYSSSKGRICRIGVRKETGQYHRPLLAGGIQTKDDARGSSHDGGETQRRGEKRQRQSDLCWEVVAAQKKKKNGGAVAAGPGESASYASRGTR